MSDIGDIKNAAGEYRKWALMARKKYLLLRQKQDLEISAMYDAAIKAIAADIKTASISKASVLQKVLKSLEEEMSQLNDQLNSAIGTYIESGVDAGATFSKSVTVDVLKKGDIAVAPMLKEFVRANTRAIEACWARSHKGLKLSDRIWNATNTAQDAVKGVIQAGVSGGMDAVEVAKALTTYTSGGSKALVTEYPEMMQRIGSRVPVSLDYNALRLARTEMTAAYGEGTVAAATVSPSMSQVKWVLSKSHPVFDVCDINAHGGKNDDGVYDAERCPAFPGHPNCICHLQPVPEKSDDFLKRLQAWRKNPASQPDIEKWYKEIYKGSV